MSDEPKTNLQRIRESQNQRPLRPRISLNPLAKWEDKIDLLIDQLLELGARNEDTLESILAIETEVRDLLKNAVTLAEEPARSPPEKKAE